MIPASAHFIISPCMSFSKIKASFPPKLKERIRAFVYSPWVLRDILLCLYWGIKRPIGLRLLGVPLIQQSRRGAIQIGDGFKAVSSAKHNSIGVLQRVTIKALGPNGTIKIGKNVGISGATVSSRIGISIGDNVLLGSGVLISDNDAHPLHPNDRHDASKTLCAPVEIGNDVFIGARSIILKGVKLGTGCVVGAGSVVSRDVPELTVVAGNPAKIIKKLG